MMAIQTTLTPDSTWDPGTNEHAMKSSMYAENSDSASSAYIYNMDVNYAN